MRQAVRRRLQYTGEFNIHGGITVPIRAPGIEWGFMSLTLGHRVAIEEFSPLLLSATYFTNCLQAALARMAAESAPHAPDLSVRETEVLRWSALGKTSWEISAILRISEATVNFHVKRVAAKLGVKGRRAAVARAIALDAIRL
ncbi:MAG: hypothetical protein JNN30_15320 [Rhodanobacteraceae bacterium]|nr:hypothetical protein [Rhodanobacteraceae bacterium]